MRSSFGRVALAAALGLFCLSAVSPAPSLAQDKMPRAQKAEMAPKMAKKAGANTQVMKLQQTLNKFGADLKVDGVMGRKTRAALKKYQSANGIKASGRLDQATRAKLSI